VGIIGCGALGRIHARRIAAIPDVEVAGVADPDRRAMETVAAELEVALLQTLDYRELLDSGLDAVCIATPDSLHVPQVMDALSAGLHVLCEKPLTLDPLELDAVIASRDEVGKIVSLTYPRRYDRGIQRMREEILSGRWGAVQTVTAYNAEDWITPNVGTWRHDPELCPGGFFYDASGHQLDTLFWVTGLSGESVTARIENRGTPVPIVATGTAALTGGIPFVFAFVGDAQKWREQCNIHCENMDFAIENGRAFWGIDGHWQPVQPALPEETGDEAFIRLIRGQGPNWSPVEAVWPILNFTRAALESAATGSVTSVE
jgi:predicted dehydrogenase